MKNILIDMPVHAEGMARLKSLPGIVSKPSSRRRRFVTFRASQIESVHFLFCTFPPRNLEVMRSLEFVQIASAGYGQLIHLGWTARAYEPATGWATSMFRLLNGILR